MSEGNAASWSTAQVAVPESPLEQVIGQDQAVAMARLAARQRRCLFLIGEPGTGKSMIGRAMAQLLPEAPAPLVTVLRPNSKDPMRPQVTRMAPSEWAALANATRAASRVSARSRLSILVAAVIAALAVACVGAYHQRTLGLWSLTFLPVLVLVGVWVATQKKAGTIISHRHVAGAWLPKMLVTASRAAPFVDGTGLTGGALFGDVRHDPYQSGGHETPPHTLVEPGAIHRAHGGVLYIDEIATLSIDDQRLLLTAMQDKALPIAGRSSLSSGCLIQTDPVPCDFVLVAAGHEDDLDRLLPALRSRIRGMGYEIKTRSALANTEYHRQALMRFISQEVRKDGRIPHFDRTGVKATIEAARVRTNQADHLTLRLRELGGLVRLAGDLAVESGAELVSEEHVRLASAQLLPWDPSGDMSRIRVAPGMEEVHV